MIYDPQELIAPVKNIYMNVSDEVRLNLLVMTPRGHYDIAAPMQGYVDGTGGGHIDAANRESVQWTVSDPTVARVTDTGYVAGLRAGSAILTAQALGFTQSITVSVLGGSSSEGGSTANPGSSGGGCSAGFTVIALLSVLGLYKKGVHTLNA